LKKEVGPSSKMMLTKKEETMKRRKKTLNSQSSLSLMRMKSLKATSQMKKTTIQAVIWIVRMNYQKKVCRGKKWRNRPKKMIEKPPLEGKPRMQLLPLTRGDLLPLEEDDWLVYWFKLNFMS
jgi:hypothetical protein